jgi:hypothetical protein
MVKNRAGKWMVARSQRMSVSFVSAALLVCGVLLLQAGCQQGASDKTSSVTHAEQKQPAAAEKAVVAAPVANKEQPAQNVSQEKAAQPQAQPQTAGGVPKIEVKEVTQNFGDIGPETTHTTKFEFKNAGNAPLRILRVKSCCGSVTRGVKAGQEFAPGESGALEVEYRTSTYPGPLQRSLSIETNDPEQPVANLTIKANVVYRIEHFPTQLNLFPKKANAGCGPITLRSTDGKPFSITAFKSTANTLTAEFDPNVKATEFVLKPKADVEKLGRNTRGRISISLTHPECPEVSVEFDVSPEFSVTPQQLTLFNVKANQPIQREIWIMSNYDEDFDIAIISSQHGTIKVLESKKMPGTPKPDAPASSNSGRTGTRYQVRVEITPPAQEDKRTMLTDVLEVQLKGGETLTVQCRGIYAAN